MLLYELLTGTTPLERARLRQAALRRDPAADPGGGAAAAEHAAERARATLAVDRGAAADRAGAADAAGARRARLDRDEGLEKDRTRRYETANGLARDVERYLDDEPVEACPPSAGYRLRKFARKHRTALAVAAGFARPAGGRRPRQHLAGRGGARAEEQTRHEAARAVAAERLAHRERAEAEARRAEAEAARRSLQRSLYASDMQLAEEAWESGDLPRMRDLLERHRPRPDAPDLRGFEWHYLRGLGTTVHVATLAHDATFGQLSPDGTHYVYVGRLVAPQAPDAGPKIELKLLDVASGRPVRRIVPFPGESMGNVDVRLAFSPDGKRFLLATRGDRRRWRRAGSTGGSRSSTGRPVAACARWPISAACRVARPSTARAGGWPW